MRVKTYDFEAFCRGQLVRTSPRHDSRQRMREKRRQRRGFWDRVIERIEAPVRWEIETEDGRMFVIPLYVYGLYQPPYFLTVPVDEEETLDERAKPQLG